VGNQPVSVVCVVNLPAGLCVWLSESSKGKKPFHGEESHCVPMINMSVRLVENLSSLLASQTVGRDCYEFDSD
jgi:hypothetical protein